MLALLVLHRAKLLASNQSIIALGIAPRQVAGTPVPVFSPFPGKGGRGDRDYKFAVFYKNRLFLQDESINFCKNFYEIFKNVLTKSVRYCIILAYIFIKFV